MKPLRTIAFVCILLYALSARSEHLHLFRSGTEGYPRYRVPSLAVTSRGTIVAICQGRADGGGLTGNVDLVCKRSRDDGKTWSQLEIVADMDNDTLGAQSVVVDRKTELVWIACTVNPGQHPEKSITRGETEQSTRVLVMWSSDDGDTWSPPREITESVKQPDWTWYGCGPGVGIQLTSGRLFFACYHAEGKLGGTYRSHAIFSDDHGKSWSLGGNAGTDNGEPQALQRQNGSIYISARTSAEGPHLRSIIESHDEGSSWCKKWLDRSLYDAHCQASLLKLTAEDGKPLWLYCHPAGPKRQKLTVRLSRDEGNTWNAGSMLLRDGDGQYTSLALLANGRVGVFYDRWQDRNYQLYFATFTAEDIK